MTGQVDAWRRLVKADPGLAARDKLVGLTLVEHRWQSGTYSRREHDLAADLSMHPSSVFRALRALSGYLRVVVPGRKGVQQVYELTFPADDSGRRPCIADTPTQVGARAGLATHSAMHRAVAEPGSQLCADAYPSLVDTQIGPISRQVPALKTKSGINGKPRPTPRLTVSSPERTWLHLGTDFPRCLACRRLLHAGLVAAGLTRHDHCRESTAYADTGAASSVGPEAAGREGKGAI